MSRSDYIGLGALHFDSLKNDKNAIRDDELFIGIKSIFKNEWSGVRNKSTFEAVKGRKEEAKKMDM